MKKYTLSWINNIDEGAERTESETQEILKDLDKADEKNDRLDKTNNEILKYTAAAGGALLFAGLAQMIAGGAVGNTLTQAGGGTMIAGALGIMTGTIAGLAIGEHIDRVERLIKRKRRIIQEIAELRANQVEEVEDEIQ